VEEDNDAILVELCDRLEQGVVCALVERRWDALSKSSSSPGKKTLHATELTQQEQQLRAVLAGNWSSKFSRLSVC